MMRTVAGVVAVSMLCATVHPAEANMFTRLLGGATVGGAAIGVAAWAFKHREGIARAYRVTRYEAPVGMQAYHDHQACKPGPGGNAADAFLADPTGEGMAGRLGFCANAVPSDIGAAAKPILPETPSIAKSEYPRGTGQGFPGKLRGWFGEGADKAKGRVQDPVGAQLDGWYGAVHRPGVAQP